MKTKEEYKVGTLTTIKDNFRAYPNDVEGVKGYYDFISTTRYANLKKATTPLEYAQMLKADGYATSSTYVNTLVSTVNKYKLDKYDKIVIKDDESAIKDVTDIAMNRPILRRNSRGLEVEAWQIYLNSHGYQCGKADGIFGAKTEVAVRAWQRDHGLISDGIIGSKTWASLPVVN